MNILHHLDDATLLRYASGDLDEAFSVVAAAHIGMCETCRKAVRTAEEVGGHLLDDIEPEALSGSAVDRMMMALDAPQPEPAAAADEPAAAEGDVPLPLRRYIGPSLAAVHWQRLAPGVARHRIELKTETKSSLYMLRIAPGKSVPEHGHGGSEMTLILSGAYRDDLGRFGPGDVADLDEHVEHRPKVEGDEPCICLVTTEAPTRFKNVISRILQPLFGI